MGKIIIENRSSLDDSLAVGMALKVIEGGRVSNNGKQYCYYTTFADDEGRKYGVATDINKKSDRFVIVNDKNGKAM